MAHARLGLAVSQVAHASLVCSAVLVGGCNYCRESYLAGFGGRRSDPAPFGAFRDAQSLHDAAIAVGDAGLIARVDGQGLTVIDADVDVDLHALIRISGKPDLLAIGDAGTLLRSADGATWSPVDAGTSADLHGGARLRDGIVVVGDATALVSADDGTTWTPLVGDGSSPKLRSVIGLGDGAFALSATGEVFTLDLDAGTWNQSAENLGAPLRNVERDAVGDAWLVLTDGSMWYGYSNAGAVTFSPGADGPCGDVPFRSIGGYTLCDDGRVRELNAFIDDPGVPFEFPAFRAGVSIIVDFEELLVLFGEDDVARLYAPTYRKRRAEYCD